VYFALLRLNETALELMAETLHDLNQVRYEFGSRLLVLQHALIITDTLTSHFTTPLHNASPTHLIFTNTNIHC